MILRAHILVEGRVQGVFYRSFTQKQAVKLQLNGWVKNLSDGRVEAVFEGPKDLVEEAIKACRRGPSSAIITNIDIIWETPSGHPGFEIRY